MTDRVDQIGTAFVRLRGATAANGPCDLAAVALLAVATEEVAELALGQFGQQVGGSLTAARIHAHIERRIDGVREAALRLIDLHRGDAEVEQNRVGLDALDRERAKAVDEIALEETHGHIGVRGAERAGAVLDGRIAVNGDVGTAAVHDLGQHRGVTAGAERAVDDGHAGRHVEQRHDLVREHRIVDRGVSGHHGPGALRHSRRSLPIRRGHVPRSPDDHGRPRRRSRGSARRAA